MQFKLNNPATLTGRNLINVTDSGTVTSGDLIGFAFVMVCGPSHSSSPPSSALHVPKEFANCEESLCVPLQATSAASPEQELPIAVRVKNIHYVMTSLHVAAPGSWNLRVGEPRIPRGLTLQLKVSLHDNVGHEILHHWDANEHLVYSVARRDGMGAHIDRDFGLTVS